MITIINRDIYEMAPLVDKLKMLKGAFIKINNYFSMIGVDANLKCVMDILDFSIRQLELREARITHLEWIETVSGIMLASIDAAQTKINTSEDDESIFSLANPTVTYVPPTA